MKASVSGDRPRRRAVSSSRSAADPEGQPSVATLVDRGESILTDSSPEIYHERQTSVPFAGPALSGATVGNDQTSRYPRRRQFGTPAQDDWNRFTKPVV